MTFKWEFIIVFALSVVLSFVVFGNGIGGDFVFDDVVVIQNRGDLKDTNNFFNLFISPYHQNSPKSGLYRPLTVASYAINHYISSKPAGFHVLNIIIHALNSFLVFWLINALFKKKFLAWATFLLFLTHPIHTEAVTSIVGRGELLAFFWSMTAIYFFLRKNTILSGVAFFLGLLSKEIAIVALPMMFYLDVFLLKNNTVTNSIKKLCLFIAPLGLYSILRYVALGHYFLRDAVTTIIENPLKFVPFSERIGTALVVLVLYIKKLILPFGLSADYSYSSILIVKNFLTSPTSIIGLLILLVLIVLVFHKKIPKEIAFGGMIFLTPYLTISNLIKPIGTIMGERLMYFPSLGFILIDAFLLNKLFYKKDIYKKISFGILATLLIFYSVRTFVRNRDWFDSRTLFSSAIRESPNSLIVRTALAGVSIEAGDWNQAKTQLVVAEGIYQDNARLQNLLGIVADHEKNYQLAEEKYKKSIELNPDAINAHINLAELYLKLGNYKEAGGHFLKVIEFYPVPEYVIRYAYIQIALNNPDEAIRIADTYLGNSLNQPNTNALLGTAYFVKKDYRQAEVFLKKAIEFGNIAPEIKEMLKIIQNRP